MSLEFKNKIELHKVKNEKLITFLEERNLEVPYNDSGSLSRKEAVDTLWDWEEEHTRDEAEKLALDEEAEMYFDAEEESEETPVKINIDTGNNVINPTAKPDKSVEELKKEYTTIILHDSELDDAPHVFVGVNEYQVYLPKHIEINVSESILEVLNKAVVLLEYQDTDDSGKLITKTKRIHRFPYTVVAS